jgi:hypothetical protein
MEESVIGTVLVVCATGLPPCQEYTGWRSLSVPKIPDTDTSLTPHSRQLKYTQMRTFPPVISISKYDIDMEN